MNPPSKILVLADNPQHPLFSSWLATMGEPVEGLTYVPSDYEFPADAGLVVSADCYHEPRVTLLRRAMEKNIPTLVLADGILEYRNTWEHPQLPAGSLFQPVLGHKIACLGRSQARVLESWHNGDRCEVTGSPRFDRYTGMKRRQRGPQENFRVLVMTALTPYFTPEHQQKVKKSLLDLKAAFARKPIFGGVKLEPVWRLTKGLDKEIGVDAVVSDLTGREMADVLQNVDAVITTPSTSMLEAMLLGLPVVALDYCNTPHYVQPAWRITASDHIAATLAELVNPPAAKLLFQDATLHDALECTTPAAGRVQDLAREMIRLGQEARRSGGALVFPARMAAADGVVRAVPEARFKLDELYPDQPQFASWDVAALQVENGHLRQHAAELEKKCQAVRASAAHHAQLTVAWKSKVEAAAVLVEHGEPQAATKLLLAGVKAVEACQNPPVILEALLAIAPALGALDAGRARYLLEVAVKLAGGLKNQPARDLATRHLTELAAASAGAAVAALARA
ncbi:MAG: hypothetical protein JWM32_1522 [Verrucomicrobia bacterium]|nr:hypothetical protein [Verrucomicrobiota bacterium]